MKIDLKGKDALYWRGGEPPVLPLEVDGWLVVGCLPEILLAKLPIIAA